MFSLGHLLIVVVDNSWKAPCTDPVAHDMDKLT